MSNQTGSHARAQREFCVTVTRQDKTVKRTVWANTSFEALSDALDEHSLGCRIEVKALPPKLTEADLDAHIAARNGPILRRLPSGRDVLDTGRVLVGIRHSSQAQRAQGSQADAIQTALLRRPDPRTHVRGSTIPLPRDKREDDTLPVRAEYNRAMRRVAYLDNSFTARVVRAVLRAFGGRR